MDGSQFDAWTRRRFGVAAGGLTAALLGFLSLDEAEAKNKGRRRRRRRRKNKECKVLGSGCNPTGKKKCCEGLSCEPPTTGGNRCCLVDAQPCANADDCCSGFCLDDECQPASCKELGQACTASAQCCSGACDTATSFTCILP
jgi:hypothetical protein